MLGQCIAVILQHHQVAIAYNPAIARAKTWMQHLRDGKYRDTVEIARRFAVRVQCKSADGTQMLGDVNFTPRDDKTIDFSDLHQTYKATLYKCRD